MTANMFNLLTPSTTSLHLTAKSSTEVISHLSQLLLDGGYVRDSFAEAVLAREKKMPTGLPLNGKINAAIPHTDIEHILKPSLALATLVEPVTFQNMISPDEAVSVQLVFVLALNQPKTQIEMLQKIASILQQTETVARLIKANNFQDVQQILSV